MSMTRTQRRTVRVRELSDQGKTRPEIVDIIADEEGIKKSTAKTFVYSLLSGDRYSMKGIVNRLRSEATQDVFNY